MNEPQVDGEKVRRESIRWQVLQAAAGGAPWPVSEALILVWIQAVPIQCTALELRRAMDYLAQRELITLQRNEGAPWFVTLTRDGTDVVEYTVACDPGIARPKKYW